jgi:hypothetical protein
MPNADPAEHEINKRVDALTMPMMGIYVESVSLLIGFLRFPSFQIFFRRALSENEKKTARRLIIEFYGFPPHLE